MRRKHTQDQRATTFGIQIYFLKTIRNIPLQILGIYLYQNPYFQYVKRNCKVRVSLHIFLLNWIYIYLIFSEVKLWAWDQVEDESSRGWYTGVCLLLFSSSFVCAVTGSMVSIVSLWPNVLISSRQEVWLWGQNRNHIRTLPANHSTVLASSDQ